GSGAAQRALQQHALGGRDREDDPHVAGVPHQADPVALPQPAGAAGRARRGERVAGQEGHGGGHQERAARQPGVPPAPPEEGMSDLDPAPVARLAAELKLRPEQVLACARLLDEGATVPFISRYRKEATGTLDEVAVAAIRDGLEALRELDKR